MKPSTNLAPLGCLALLFAVPPAFGGEDDRA
jgi:hypothetical protein